MGLFSFVKSAGSSLFGGKKPSETENLAYLVRKHLREQGLPSAHVRCWQEKEVMIVSGWAPDRASKEKIILAVGNVDGVDQVEDRLAVGSPPQPATPPMPVEAEAVDAVELTAEQLPSAEDIAAAEFTSRTYTVQKGDTLSKIAKEMYGNAGKYPVIFEANQPMLKHPDKIYPGQVLRIPPLD
jgi:nucleoid-associated protein YgaU